MSRPFDPYDDDPDDPVVQVTLIETLCFFADGLTALALWAGRTVRGIFR